jgi:hypothetical protein
VALVIDAVADGPSGNCADGATDQGASESIMASAVVADDRSGKGADGATSDSSLLSVRARAHAARAESK